MFWEGCLEEVDFSQALNNGLALVKQRGVGGLLGQRDQSEQRHGVGTMQS